MCCPQEICTPDVVYCSPDTTVLAAARLMQQKHVGDLIVAEDPEGEQIPLGLVTDRDLVVEVLAKERDPNKVARNCRAYARQQRKTKA